MARKNLLSAELSSNAGSSRERLLAAAKRQFAVDGYEQTTTARIARLAKTSESQLMKHFENKQGILQAIFAAGWGAINEAAKQAIRGERPEAKLGIIMRTVMMMLERDPELRLLLLMEGRRLRNGHRVMITADFLAFVALLDDVLRELQALGILIPTLHPHAVRSALMGAIEGLLRDRTLAETAGYPAQYDLHDFSEVFRLLIASFSRAKAGQKDARQRPQLRRTIEGRSISPQR
jgi:AcrR family transcriptional regulator